MLSDKKCKETIDALLGNQVTPRHYKYVYNDELFYFIVKRMEKIPQRLQETVDTVT